MKKKNILSILLVATLFFSACGTMGGENVESSTSEGAINKISLPDYDAKREEYGVKITGWITPATMTDEQLTYVVEAGVDTLFYQMNTYAPSEEDLAALERCKKYGIDIYLTTGAKDGAAIGNVVLYNDYDAVVGMTIDEPEKDDIDKISALVDAYNAASDGKTLYTNLYPSFHNRVQLDFTGGYEEYVRYYCDNVMEKLSVGEKWLSADRYPLTYNVKNEKCLDSGWLHDLETIVTVAKDYEDVQTNFFIQTMPYGSGTGSGSRNRVPTYEDILMQEYTLMAFGYDSISLFCYGTPAVGPEFSEEQVALIDRSGQRTDIYYAAQKANKEILAFDHVIQQFDWKGVFTNDAGLTTTGKYKTTNASFSNLVGRLALDEVACLNEVTTSEDTLFGYFIDYEDNEGFMVVNYNETTLGKTDDVKMTFDPSYKYNKCLCYIDGEKKVYDVKNNVLQLTLDVGEGVFIIPYHE